jgi:hypothetical protein
MLLQILLGVVVHRQHGDVEARLCLHRVEQLVLSAAGWAPVSAEVQRHRRVGLPRFSHGRRRTGLDLERVGRNGSGEQRSGGDELDEPHGVPSG